MDTDKRNALAIGLLKAYAIALFVAIITMHMDDAVAGDWPDATLSYKWEVSYGASPPQSGTGIDLADAKANMAAWLIASGFGSDYASATWVAVTGSCSSFPTFFDCHQGQIGGVGTNWYYAGVATCPGASTVDYSHSPPRCVNTVCVTNQGKFFDFDFTVSGASGAFGPGSQICQEGCRADVIRGGRFDITLADGSTYGGIHGTGRISAFACDAGNKVSTRTGAYRNNDTGAATQGTAATGTSGGPGQNDGQASNTARIATNTDRIAEILASGGSSTTAPPSTVDSGCGRPGQPACNINEGDTVASSSGVAGEISAHRTGMEDAMDAQKNAVTASASEQFGASSRWVFSAVPFFAGVTATCSLAWPVHIPSLGIDQTYSISICSWTPLWHDFAAWALYAMTAVALWLTIYGKGEK